MSKKSLLYWGYFIAAFALVACSDENPPLGGGGSGTGGASGNTPIVKGQGNKPTEAPPSILSGGLFGGKPSGDKDTTGPKDPSAPATGPVVAQPPTPAPTPAADGSVKRDVTVTAIVVDLGIFKSTLNIVVPVVEKKTGDKYTSCEFDKGHALLGTVPESWKGLPVYFYDPGKKSNTFPKELESSVKPAQVDEKDASFRLDIEQGKGFKIPLQVRNVLDEQRGCVVFLELTGKDFGIAGTAITATVDILKKELKSLTAQVQSLSGPNKTPAGDLQTFTF